MARYELLERIGVGGMAEIFRGTAIAGSGFEKPVAIKRILPHLSQDQRFIELLIAEAKILSELQHRNIVQIFDVGLGDDGQYFLVMEFVDGTDLKRVYEHLFDGRRLPVEVALHICSEICEALEHAHLAKGSDGKGLGLVHRDVSPSNVLLSKSGEVKLTDFGIAKRVEEVTGHGGVRGKFAYISPEQAMNKHVDARSDVYSVGILLYELACGQRLFSGLADFDALREVRQGRVRPSPEHISGVAPELAKMIMRALSKDPDERYRSAGEFGSALRGYRYSLDTEIADPGAEIASLVSREGRAPERLDESDDGAFSLDEGHSKVVRIDTAAEFNLTDLSGLHQLVSSFPEPRIDTGEEDFTGFDDMKTATMDAKSMAAMIKPGVGTIADPNTPTEKSAKKNGSLAFQTTDRAPVEAAGKFPDADEDEPTELHARVDSPYPAALPGVAKPRPSTINAPPPRPNVPRTDTPTEKDVFHQHLPPAQTVLPGHYPGYASGGMSAFEAESRRRKIQMGLIGGAVALLAFVVAGHFLGSGQAAVVSEADAGVSDAGIADAKPDVTTEPDVADASVKKPIRKAKWKPKGKGKKGKGKKGKGKKGKGKKGKKRKPK